MYKTHIEATKSTFVYHKILWDKTLTRSSLPSLPLVQTLLEMWEHLVLAETNTIYHKTVAGEN